MAGRGHKMFDAITRHPDQEVKRGAAERAGSRFEPEKARELALRSRARNRRLLHRSRRSEVFQNLMGAAFVLCFPLYLILGATRRIADGGFDATVAVYLILAIPFLALCSYFCHRAWRQFTRHIPDPDEEIRPGGG